MLAMSKNRPILDLPKAYVPMKPNRYFLSFAALLALGAQSAIAQSVVSDPLGFNTVTCLPSCDTIVGVPFRPNGSQQGTLASAPTGTDGDSATLSLAGSPGFTADEFKDTHYVKFTSGALDGHFYAITGNTADTLTVDLNGELVPAAAADDGVIIAKFWTLDALFPPGDSTTDPTTTGHAIVASADTMSWNRRTEVLIPDLATKGINLPPNRTFFIDASTSSWKEATQSGFVPGGNFQLWPDTYFVIRHPVSVTNSTSFKCSGEVENGGIAIPLATSTNGKQDSFVAIPRPISVKLKDLGLISSAAFTPSNGTASWNRKDELLVYDYEKTDAGRNRVPDATYFYDSSDSHWKKSTQTGFVVADDDEILAGAGLVVRKVAGTGKTAFWVNYPGY